MHRLDYNTIDSGSKRSSTFAMFSLEFASTLEGATTCMTSLQRPSWPRLDLPHTHKEVKEPFIPKTNRDNTGTKGSTHVHMF